MPTIITEGALAAKGFGFGASSAAANYIEDVFSTYLYTANDTGQTITNGIDLSGKGGMVWVKNRSQNGYGNIESDTVRGNTKALYFSGTNAEITITNGITSFNSNGFTIGSNPVWNQTSPDAYVSWSFRKQTKFFDIVTYTGTGANGTIAHNLGSTPGSIWVKRLDTTSDWQVYHSGLTSAAYSIQLNLTNAQASATTVWNSTAPTSSVFSVGTSTDVNSSGGTYVAYLFASNAGGFGAAGADNVITCGSYTGNGSATGPIVTLGYEPQWLLIKRAAGLGSWEIVDNMRGWSVGSNSAYLYANSSNSEVSTATRVTLSSTGFQPTSTSTGVNASGENYVYIAIRRGPMKTPTSGTSVFSPVYATFSGSTVTDTGFVTDMVINKIGTNLTGGNFVEDRLRGADNSTNQITLNITSISGESPSSGRVALTSNSSPTIQNGFLQQSTTANTIVWAFARAPGFFDEVCYTGTGANTTQTHNLGVVPELMIVKERSAANAWQVYSSALANTEYLVLNTTAAKATGATRWNSTTPTSSVFSIGTDATVNASTQTYVAYLFASCPGVSKVGSYTGTGATQTINCGFTSGARFVLIKRTDSTGDWYVWDTARGMVAGTDPSLLLNSTAAEINANSVYTTGVGFQIVSTAAGINASGGTYIYLAIA